ncbi:MAG: sigma-70 family RNA polymerase sigma factor [Pseudomonadota bacterium]
MQPTPSPADAFARAVESHRPEVQGYLRGQVGCAEVAADIFQTIAENLLGRDDLTPISNLRAYLFQAARNAAVNHHLAEQARAGRDDELKARQASRAEPGPDDVLASRQKIDRLNAALLELPILTRQIFVLYRLRGVKQVDIAAQYRVHLSTVEKHLKRAIAHCERSVREC